MRDQRILLYSCYWVYALPVTYVYRPFGTQEGVPVFLTFVFLTFSISLLAMKAVTVCTVAIAMTVWRLFV
jgi:hypothetical protein